MTCVNEIRAAVAEAIRKRQFALPEPDARDLAAAALDAAMPHFEEEARLAATAERERIIDRLCWRWPGTTRDANAALIGSGTATQELASPDGARDPA